MLSLRTTPLLFVLLLVGAGSLAGQRSLYQDALALAKFDKLPENTNVTVEFRALDTTRKSEVYQVVADNDYEFPVGEEEFPYLGDGLIFKVGPYIAKGDTIILRYGPSSVSIDLWEISGQGINRPDSLADKDEVMFIAINRSVIGQYYAELNDAPYVTHKVYRWSPYWPRDTEQEGYLSLIGFSRKLAVGSILEDHLEVGKSTDQNFYASVPLSQGYELNPFIKAEDIIAKHERIDSLQYTGLEEPVIDKDWRQDRSELQYQSLYSKYIFQDILYGKASIDSNDLSISLEATSSYRQRIVTAQTRLEAANVAFQKQRKKGGLLDVNTVAVGLSDFIAERAQEELNLTFFNRFKENLAKDSELTILFPATNNLLQKFEISNYKVFLAHARETFNTDLDGLGGNLSGILKLPKYQRLRNDPNVFNLALIYDIANAAYQEKTVEEIILATHQQLVDRQKNLTESINLAIADSLLHKDSQSARMVASFAFRDDLLRYMQEVRKVSRNLNGLAVRLAEVTDDPLFNMFSDPQLDDDKIYAWRDHLSAEAVEKRNLLIASDSVRMVDLKEVALSIFYSGNYERDDDYEIGRLAVRQHGEKVRNGYLDHSMQLIPALLEGHDYFGYYLNRSQRYSGRTFNRKQLQRIDNEVPSDYLASGLDKARELLELRYDEATEKHYRTIVEEDRDQHDEIQGEQFVGCY